MEAPGVGGQYETSPRQDDASSKAEAALDVALAEAPQEAAPAPDVPATTVPTESPSVPVPAGSTPAASPTPTPQYNDAAQAFLSKYGGDLNKAAEHYWEAVRQNAEFTRQAQPVQQQPVQEVADPEVQQLDSRLLVLDQDFRGLDGEFVKVKTKREELESTLEELTDKLSTPDLDADVPGLQRQLRNVRTDLGRVRTREQDIVRRAQENRGQFNVTAALRTQALRFQSILQARQADEAARYDYEVSSFRTSFDSALDAAAAQIPEELKSEFGDYARAMALRYLQTPGPDGQRPVISDAKGYTAALAQRYLGAFDKHHRVRSSQYGADKQKDAQLATPGTVKAAAPDKTKKRSVAEWDEMHDALVL